jgi:hypothetical protein
VSGRCGRFGLGANRAIAIRGDHLVIFPAYHKPYLTTRTLENPDTTIWELADSDGRFLLAVGSTCTMKLFFFLLFIVDDVERFYFRCFCGLCF